MAFVTIPSNAIDVGDPITKDLWDKVKNNLDDLDTRTQATEASQNTILIFDNLVLNAQSSSTATGLAYYRVPFDINVTEALVQIFEKGSLTGELEIDFKRNSTPDNTGMTSIFTTKPKITYASAADYDDSTNQVIDQTQATIPEGHYIRFDVTEFPTGGVIGKFQILLKAEVA